MELGRRDRRETRSIYCLQCSKCSSSERSGNDPRQLAPHLEPAAYTLSPTCQRSLGLVRTGSFSSAAIVASRVTCTLNATTCSRSSGSLARRWQNRAVFRRMSSGPSHEWWLNIATSSLRLGMSVSEVEVVPLATEVETSDDELMVSLSDGRRISVPLAWFPRLLNATADERAEFRLIGRGEGIHWPRIDEDISVSGLLRGSRVRTTHQQQAVLSTEYRRAEQGSTWHWCMSCSTYPTENYFTRRSCPSAELCNECAARENTDQCR